MKSKFEMNKDFFCHTIIYGTWLFMMTPPAVCDVLVCRWVVSRAIVCSICPLLTADCWFFLPRLTLQHPSSSSSYYDSNRPPWSCDTTTLFSCQGSPSLCEPWERHQVVRGYDGPLYKECEAVHVYQLGGPPTEIMTTLDQFFAFLFNEFILLSFLWL